MARKKYDKERIQKLIEQYERKKEYVKEYQKKKYVKKTILLNKSDFEKAYNKAKQLTNNDDDAKLLAEFLLLRKKYIKKLKKRNLINIFNELSKLI